MRHLPWISEVLVISHPSNGLNVEFLNVGGWLSDGTWCWGVWLPSCCG